MWGGGGGGQGNSYPIVTHEVFVFLLLPGGEWPEHIGNC